MKTVFSFKLWSRVSTALTGHIRLSWEQIDTSHLGMLTNKGSCGSREGSSAPS